MWVWYSEQPSANSRNNNIHGKVSGFHQEGGQFEFVFCVIIG